MPVSYSNHPLLLVAVATAVWLGAASSGFARPPTGAVFCQSYPDAPACSQGVVACATCHTTVPALDLYGEQIAEVLLPGEPRPLSDDAFIAALPEALVAVEGLDADSDGFTNLEELMAGSDPSEPGSTPVGGEVECSAEAYRPTGLEVCAYDPVYVYKKVMIDFCGIAPSYGEMKEFEAEPTADRIKSTLLGCLDTEFWRGKDGVLWNLANKKIKPIQAIKAGEGAGPIPLADYDDDYNFFVYVNSDDRDARDLLLGNYFVAREDGDPTVYTTWDRTIIEDYNVRGYEQAQGVSRRFRAGLLTHRWFIMSNTMFTGIPRTTAAQAYRAYLGFDISRLEGLTPIPGEPKDYDSRGVKRDDCAVCHSTLDPLTYPFTRYEGIGGGSGDIGEGYIPFTYNPSRMPRFVETDGSAIQLTPETGYIFGEQVDNLVEWAEVAANSDPFAQALVGDFWQLLLGGEPRPSELVEFEGVWRRFMTDHEYRVEAMLLDLVTTEAYGVP